MAKGTHYYHLGIFLGEVLFLHISKTLTQSVEWRYLINYNLDQKADTQNSQKFNLASPVGSDTLKTKRSEGQLCWPDHNNTVNTFVFLLAHLMNVINGSWCECEVVCVCECVCISYLSNSLGSWGKSNITSNTQTIVVAVHWCVRTHALARRTCYELLHKTNGTADCSKLGLFKVPDLNVSVRSG